jgi:glycosyltransferase involved in cell wall biosynthesis
MAGIPVVGARIGGIPDLVTDGTNGLLYDPVSPERLQAALQRLIDEPGLLDRLSAGIPPVKSIATDAREWERTYADLAGRPLSVEPV